MQNSPSQLKIIEPIDARGHQYSQWHKSSHSLVKSDVRVEVYSKSILIVSIHWLESPHLSDRSFLSHFIDKNNRRIPLYKEFIHHLIRFYESAK